MENFDDNMSNNHEIQSESSMITPITDADRRVVVTTDTNIADEDKVTIAEFGVHPLSKPVKRKRGRPRKYEVWPNGTFIVRPSPAPKKRKGPSQRSKNRSPQEGFSVDYIWFLPGEDIAAKIVSYAESISKSITILSASGTISSVILTQAFSPHGFIKREGIFEILNINGSICTDQAGHKNATLSVMLKSEYNGQLLGGTIGGPLVAATVVEMMIGSFKQEIIHEALYPVPLKVLPFYEFNSFRFARRSPPPPPPPPPPPAAFAAVKTENPNLAIVPFIDDGFLASTSGMVDELMMPVPTSNEMNYSGNEI